MNVNDSCPECDRLLRLYSEAVHDYLWLDNTVRRARLSYASAEDVAALEAERDRSAAVRQSRRDEIAEHQRAAHRGAAGATSV